MKRLHSPDQRGEDSGDTDRGIPDAIEDEGGLRTGFEPDVHDPRADGKQTRALDEAATRRHNEGAEQGPM